ncbi:MAG TPA: HlyD family efflux transporter periplasmic adaptor subunit [Bryobacteraceae bacterium]|jgi:multidrug resistance efflux pump|nr:HlyD family efflux transporter periplasmic adaptor subunit [Bryobacteraceae bacterium]
MRGKWLLISVAALLAGAGAAALSLRWKSPAAPVPKGAAAPVPAASEVTLSGKIRPQHITTVKAGVDGAIDALLVDVGEDVFAGEVLARVGSAELAERRDAAAAAVSAAQEQESRAETAAAAARLEASRAEADRQRARAVLDRAQAFYDRQEMLNRHGATPRLSWEKAQRDRAAARQESAAMEKAAGLSAAQLQSALNDLAAAQKTLASLNLDLADARDGAQSGDVASPVDGTVVARNGEVGGPAGDDLFEIATDMFALETAVEPEPATLARLRPGQPAMVAIPDLQNAGMEGRIRAIENNAAIVEFNCTLAGVRPGMPVQVRLKLQ